MMLIYEERAPDAYFSRFILRLIGRETCDSLPLRLAVSMAARSAASGDVCFDLASIHETMVEYQGNRIAMPSMRDLRSLLYDSGAAVAPGATGPLVLDEKGRLYLYRYWKLEHDLAARLLKMAGHRAPETAASDALSSLRTMGELEAGGMQERAVIAALTGKLTIIAGGPGTGKTATVGRILSILRQQEGGRKKGLPSVRQPAKRQHDFSHLSRRCPGRPEPSPPSTDFSAPSRGRHDSGTTPETRFLSTYLLLMRSQ